MTTIKTWHQAEARLAEVMPGFRSRPQQQELGQRVAQAVSGNSAHPVLMSQAGCGVGKSLGYLIPAIAGGGRTIVAVSTKALQDQLMGKDLPMLHDTLFPALTFASLKGRSNYVCQRAADKNNLTAAVTPGSAGERQDLLRPVDDKTWSEISVDAEGCVGKGCPFRSECHSERARQKALNARVVVVNTSLLTQDLRLRGMTKGNASLLGDFDFLVVDEAHEMPDIVSGGLSTRVSLRRIVDCASKLTYHLSADKSAAWVSELVDEATAYFDGCSAWFKSQDERTRTAELAEEDFATLARLCTLLDPLHKATQDADCSCEPGESPDGEIVEGCEFARRIASLATDLELFARSEGSINVVWMERTRAGQVALMSSPAEVGGFLDSTLWHPNWRKPERGEGGVPVTRAALTSATLAVGGDFTYLARRLGLKNYDSMDVGTPFDFERQARTYLASADAPNPSKEYGRWKMWAQRETTALVNSAGGGALLLFTSTAAMRESYDALRQRFANRGWHSKMQGDGLTNRELSDWFQRDTHGVLFATRSFMTGVDFAGDTCRLVVLDKMPFPVPDEPVFKARCAAVDARFGERSSFGRVSVPEMSLVLIQAYGRLIRTVDDTGVVAILDPRMRAGWAAPIRRSLPPAPVVGSSDDVAAFYGTLALRTSGRAA
jgi:ATP-dependent DNA helicase DinG